MPSEKAPSPDGFIGIFYKKCWDIIKEDLFKVVRSFFDLSTTQLEELNSAFIVLLPKHEQATSADKFRPISLIHSFAKIVTKILANRLAPRLGEMISHNQSAFIRKRAIHENFLYVQNLVKRLHRAKKPTLMFKLDITKAFDSINWQYLLERLQAFGFGSRWREWICALFRTSTSKVILNGKPGEPIHQARGVRQGDPLSLMLFILAMEPLNYIFSKAEEAGSLSPLHSNPYRYRISLYVDDVALFVKPTEYDITNLKKLLLFFGNVTGLCNNVQKTHILPIASSNLNVNSVSQNFPGTLSSFPTTYLGLPLHLR